MSEPTAPRLTINPQGEAVVHSAGFRRLLQAKARANILDYNPLPEIPQNYIREALDENSGGVHSSLDEIVKQANAAPAPVAQDTTPSGERRARPAPVPAAGIGLKYKQVLSAAHYANDPAARQKYIQVAEKLMSIDFDPRGSDNLGLSKNLDHIAAVYQGFMHQFVPELDTEVHWHVDVVRKYAELFFFNLVQCTRGQDGGPIRSSTLAGWISLFVRLIGRHAYTGDHHKAAGSELLASGFYVTLEARRKWLVNTFKLNKEPAPRQFLSPADLAAIFEVGFAATEEYGRESFIQTQLAINICFFTGLRSGSLASGNPKFKQLGLYIKLKHVTIIVVKPGLWNVKLIAPYRKGYNQVDDPGYSMEFFLEHVTKVHNLIFDVGLFLVLALHLRGAFDMSLKKVFAYAGSILTIKQDMLEQPLILARGPKGHELIMEPATSVNINESFNEMAQNAGLPGATFRSIRHYIGNIWGLVLGAQAARRLLGHVEGQTVFDQNYSKNSLNYDLVPAALGELDHGANAANRMSLMRNRDESMIVDAIINMEIEEDAGEGGKGEKLTPTQKQKLKEDPVISMFDTKMSETWDAIHSLLPVSIEIQYERNNKAIPHIRNHCTSNGVQEYQDNKEKIEQLFARLTGLGQMRATQARSVSRRLRYVKKSDRFKAFDKKKEDHTLAQLAEAKMSLNAPVTALEEEEETEEGTLESYSTQFYNLNSPAFRQQITDAKFGQGVLTDDALKQLRAPDLNKFLSAFAKRHLDDPEDTGFYFADPETITEAPVQDMPNLEDPEDASTDDMPPNLPAIFDDKTEMTVLKANLVNVKQLFGARLVNPVFHARQMKALIEANGGKCACPLCAGWRHAKPANMKGIYANIANFKRHLQDIHTPWNDLRCLMLTESETEFKCPSPQCDFTADSVAGIYQHCVSIDCPDQLLFKQMKRACKRKTTGHSKNYDTMQRKRARALKYGVEMAQGSVETFKLLTEAEDSVILGMARDVHITDPDLKAQIPLVREMIRLGSKMIKDGKMFDQHALDPIEAVYEEMTNDKEEEWLQREIEGISDQEALAQLGTLDLDEILTVSSLSGSEEEARESRFEELPSKIAGKRA